MERFIRYLRASFYIPLASKLKPAGLILDADTANVAIWKWLVETANVRVHQTTNERPVERLAEEQKALQAWRPRPAVARATPFIGPSPVDLESVSLQHDPAIYDALLAGGRL